MSGLFDWLMSAPDWVFAAIFGLIAALFVGVGLSCAAMLWRGLRCDVPTPYRDNLDGWSGDE